MPRHKNPLKAEIKRTQTHANRTQKGRLHGPFRRCGVTCVTGWRQFVSTKHVRSRSFETVDFSISLRTHLLHFVWIVRICLDIKKTRRQTMSLVLEESPGQLTSLELHAFIYFYCGILLYCPMNMFVTSFYFIFQWDKRQLRIYGFVKL